RNSLLTYLRACASIYSSCLPSDSSCRVYIFFFFFNDPATTEIYTLSLHDALPIWTFNSHLASLRGVDGRHATVKPSWDDAFRDRSEEHTSELQSQSNLVCRLLLEKKKKKLITLKSLTSNTKAQPLLPGTYFLTCVV